MILSMVSLSRAQRSRIAALIFSFLLVLSLPAGVSITTAEGINPPSGSSSSLSPNALGGPVEFESTSSVQVDDVSYQDNFSDGNSDGWNSTNGNDQITNDSFWGSNALLVNDPDQVYWTGGHRFNTQENFEISGTYKVETSADAADGATVRFGLVKERYTKWAVVVVNPEADEIILKGGEGNTPTDEKINNAFVGEFAQFRLQFDGGKMKLKVWKAGTQEPNDWQITHDNIHTIDSEFYLDPGEADNGQSITLDRIDAGANVISGQVVDQHGNPVDNATVEAWGVDYSALNNTIEDKKAEAERLLEEASDVKPEMWNPDLDLQTSLSEAEAIYPAVHTKDDWTIGHDGAARSPDLQTPLIKVSNPDEEIILSAWDPSDRGLTQDGIDKDLPGSTTEGTILITALGPGNAELETMKVDLDETLTTGFGSSINPWSREHSYASINLPHGFYHISVEGSNHPGYVIAVGDPDDIAEVIQDRLETQAGQLTDHAQQIAERVRTGVFSRTTVTTNANGEFTMRIRGEIQTAKIQAYRADGTILTGITGPSMSDLRQAADRGYNGSVYISPTSQTYDIPAENVTVEVYKWPRPPFQDLTSFGDFKGWLQEMLATADFSDLPPFVQERLDELTRGELEELYTELDGLREHNSELTDRYLDLINRDSLPSQEDLSDAELREQIAALNQALNQMRETIEAGKPEVDVTGELVNLRFPFAGDLVEEGTSVIVHYSDGTHEVMGQDYWHVESPALGQDAVVIEDFQLGEDKAALAQIEVRTANENGMGRAIERVPNPGFSGQIPEIDSIDLSTLRPGPNERVAVQLNSEDEAFERLDTVEVWGPNGQSVQTATISGDSTSFQTDGTGIYTVRMTYLDTTGEPFVETFRLRAEEEPHDYPASVRVIDGISGAYALAGDDLAGADVDMNADNEVSISAIAPANGDVPSEVHVITDEIDRFVGSDTTIAIQKGERRESVRKHVSVVLHTRLSENALVYRGDRPIALEGQTHFGELRPQEDGKSLIATYTDADGTVTVLQSADPGRIERALFWVLVNAPVDLPNPLAFIIVPGLPAEVVLEVATTPASAIASPGPEPTPLLTDGPTAGGIHA